MKTEAKLKRSGAYKEACICFVITQVKKRGFEKIQGSFVIHLFVNHSRKLVYR